MLLFGLAVKSICIPLDIYSSSYSSMSISVSPSSLYIDRTIMRLYADQMTTETRTYMKKDINTPKH
jgi:hypothetical protein